mmetsp:Transcript_5096/g.20350  ORF Transcript_5096/g.20350 Transcript_5096/m.20350 type:complete len:265 (-) Transcript_5096:550-1344(-)
MRLHPDGSADIGLERHLRSGVRSQSIRACVHGSERSMPRAAPPGGAPRQAPDLHTQCSACARLRRLSRGLSRCRQSGSHRRRGRHRRCPVRFGPRGGRRERSAAGDVLVAPVPPRSVDWCFLQSGGGVAEGGALQLPLHSVQEARGGRHVFPAADASTTPDVGGESPRPACAAPRHVPRVWARRWTPDSACWLLSRRPASRGHDALSRVLPGILFRGVLRIASATGCSVKCARLPGDAQQRVGTRLRRRESRGHQSTSQGWAHV